MNKNFYMVLIGQIISIFGNAILRFALPLYLLSVTHSSETFGLVSAIAFIPALLLTPIGGIIADRINKRNIMVILDFSTAIIIALYSFINRAVIGNQSAFIIAMLLTMILLYGINGIYEPSVQASIPLLVTEDKLVRANSLINFVNSGSSLLGPVLGGILYSAFGVNLILIISAICFALSAIMEIFIKIPYAKEVTTDSIIKVGLSDFKNSLHFISHDRKEILKLCILCAFLNFFESASLGIGIPIIINELLDFSPSVASNLYGIAEGVFAAGSLFGALLSSILGNKITVKSATKLLSIEALGFIPIAFILSFGRTLVSSRVNFIILIVSIFFMMTLTMIFNIRIMAELQILTPSNLLGKVFGCVFCICSIATPLGQALYGILFEKCLPIISIIFLITGGCTFLIGILTRNVFKNYDDQVYVPQNHQNELKHQEA